MGRVSENAPALRRGEKEKTMASTPTNKPANDSPSVDAGCSIAPRRKEVKVVEHDDITISLRLAVVPLEKTDAWGWWLWDDSHDLQLPESSGRSTDKEAARKAVRSAAQKLIREKAVELESLADRLDDDSEADWF